AEDGIRDFHVTGVQTCALPILAWGDRGCRLVPRWLIVASAAGAAAGLLALVSFRRNGLLSPDVQQQVSGNAALLWPLLTGGALRSEERRVGKETSSRAARRP